jgi:hypothetical protein
MPRLTGFLSLFLFVIWSCTTPETVPPQPSPWIIKTTAVAKLGGYKASSGGMVIGRGSDVILSKGVCWSNNQPLPVFNLISGNKTDEGPGGEQWTSTITGLTPNDTIWVRSYAYTKNGTYYGQVEKYFVPLETKPPTIVTNPVTDARKTSAPLSGRISTDGGSNIIERGFQLINYNTQTSAHYPMPIGNPDSLDPDFDTILPGLTPNTSYGVKAYARNRDFQTKVYGEEKFFFTSPDKQDAFPSVETTVGIVLNPDTSVLISGNILNQGDFPILSKGVCFGTMRNPSFSASRVEDPFTAFMTISVELKKMKNQLLPGVRYYFRAYARNEAGIGYGQEKSFVLPP